MMHDEESSPSHADYHMPWSAYRAHAHELVDWIADYLENAESYPVLSQVKPGDIRAQLPAHPPKTGEPFASMMRDVESIIMPGVTHWQSPNFFAFFPSNLSGPSLLGEMLCSGLGVQGMIWATSPACTELETLVLDWMAELLGLPAKFRSTSGGGGGTSGGGGGVIQDTASSAALCAMLVARERATNFASNQRGVRERFTVYASTQAHSSIVKAAKIAGIGLDNVRLIDVDDAFAMRRDALRAAIERDKADGCLPCFVGATVGTTSSNAIDPVRAIGDICRTHNLWLHVDAAMSGTAALCPEFRWIHDGIELADSYCFNPHKWMFTNFDCDCFYVADRAALIQTLSILPEYLRNQATESGAVIDYRDWHIPLGRRFRALKLWFVIRHYGVQGLQHHVREHVALAQQFARWVAEDADFELAAPHPLTLVCFRHVAGDAFNQRLMDRLNAGGRMYLTHTRLNDAFVLRMSIGHARTTIEHVRRAWELIRTTANSLP